MKTVMDAVIELMGDLNNARFHGEDGRFLAFHVNYGDYSPYPFGHSTDKYQCVCSSKEFNDLVSQLETNFGECDHSYSKYKEAYESIFFKKPQPVFTQAMADNGELPSVGMECCYSSSSMVIWNKCTVIAYYDGFVWASGNGVRPLANTRFKPLTPPIELICGKAYQFSVNGNEPIHGVYNRLKNGFYHIASLYNLKSCTNIQLLEVKS